jgi:abhydrolase domain-containing protein 6
MTRMRWAALGVAGFAAAAVLARATYPAIGAGTYRAAVGIESRLRGLRTRRADVAGWSVAYSEGGDRGRPTVVLLHGFSGDRDLWMRFAGHLLRDYHVMIPDLAGHGATGFRPGADYSAPAQAARVAGLLDTLGIDAVHIMGNSMGGFVAAHFAAAHPQRTRSLGLCNASGVRAPCASAMDRMLAAGHNPFLLTDTARFDAFYAMTMARPPYVPRMVLDAKARAYVDRHDELAEIFVGQHQRDPLDERLGDITAPTLILWGEEDPLADVSAARVWAAGLPDATLITYEGVGHMPMVEIPARSAADYLAFLRRVDSLADRQRVRRRT